MEPGPQDDFSITVTPIEKTSKQKAIEAVAHNARTQALTRMGQSANLTDYLRWHRAASFYFPPQRIEWMWDGMEGPTADELVADQASDRHTKVHGKNAQAVEELSSVVTGLETQEGMIRVGLKRVRDESGIYTYRVLAAFPEGTSVSDPLDREAIEKPQISGEQSIFFEPETACVSHACDDLYKEQQGKNTFYIPVKSVTDALQELQSRGLSMAEYVLQKTDAGAIKQDARNFLLVALLGGYSNERLRVRVSDFLNKPTAVSAA